MIRSTPPVPTVPARAGGPDIFLLGVSKAASTWIHRCLQENPRIFVTDSDSLRFFDMHYHEGIESYESMFADAKPGQLRVDPSPTYFRSPVASRRIAKHYPNARFVLSLRNPVDRAFSQFWHEKKQGKLDYSFEEALEHPLLFPWIVEHGYYSAHLDNLFQYFPRERVTIVIYEDLLVSPREFLGRVLDGMSLPMDFEPKSLTKRVNESGVRANVALKTIGQLRTMKWWAPVRRGMKSTLGLENTYRKLGQVVSNRDEYDRGINPQTRQKLASIYLEDLERLRLLTGMTFDQWNP
jgi:hypothetical protein